MRAVWQELGGMKMSTASWIIFVRSVLPLQWAITAPQNAPFAVHWRIHLQKLHRTSILCEIFPNSSPSVTKFLMKVLASRQNFHQFCLSAISHYNDYTIHLSQCQHSHESHLTQAFHTANSIDAYIDSCSAQETSIAISSRCLQIHRARHLPI